MISPLISYYTSWSTSTLPRFNSQPVLPAWRTSHSLPLASISDRFEQVATPFVSPEVEQSLSKETDDLWRRKHARVAHENRLLGKMLKQQDRKVNLSTQVKFDSILSTSLVASYRDLFSPKTLVIFLSIGAKAEQK